MWEKDIKIIKISGILPIFAEFASSFTCIAIIIYKEGLSFFKLKLEGLLLLLILPVLMLIIIE
ncbi:hypothetical protein COR53_07670 [Staphylococcus pettenkoferi]|nr:hypothetical protein COR53_07670 [Staphylococcus pettenkoferi]